MTDIILEIRKFIAECWANIFTEVCNSVVYIDHCAIECLHWYTAGKGYVTLKDAGAIAVYEFGMYHFRVGIDILYTIVKVLKRNENKVGKKSPTITNTILIIISTLKLKMPRKLLLYRHLVIQHFIKEQLK